MLPNTDRNAATCWAMLSFHWPTAHLPLVPRLPGIPQDLLGVAIEGERVLPGPFAREPLDAVILLPQLPK